MVQKSLQKQLIWRFSHFFADLHISQLVRDDRPTTFVNPPTPIQAGQMKMALSSMSRMRSPNLGSEVFSRYQVWGSNAHLSNFTDLIFDQTWLTTRSEPATGCHHVPPLHETRLAVNTLCLWGWWKLAVFRFVFKESHRWLEDSLLQKFQGFARNFSGCRWMNMCVFLQSQADNLQQENKKPTFLDLKSELSLILPITLQWWERSWRVQLFLLPHCLSAKQPRFANYAHSRCGCETRCSMIECIKNLSSRDPWRLQLHLLEIHSTSISSICNNNLKIRGGCLGRFLPPFQVNSHLAASAHGATPILLLPCMVIVHTQLFFWMLSFKNFRNNAISRHEQFANPWCCWWTISCTSSYGV